MRRDARCCQVDLVGDKSSGRKLVQSLMPLHTHHDMPEEDQREDEDDVLDIKSQSLPNLFEWIIMSPHQCPIVGDIIADSFVARSLQDGIDVLQVARVNVLAKDGVLETTTAGGQV